MRSSLAVLASASASASLVFAAMACGNSGTLVNLEDLEAAGGTAGATGIAGASGATVTPLGAIDPIRVGRTWTYDVTMLGEYPSCPGGSHVSEATASRPLDGKEAITVSSLCAGAGTFDYAVEGDRVFSYVEGAWLLSLDAPVEPGHTWSDGYFSYVWETAADAKVGDRTLTNCFTARKQVAFESYTTFCRGVGPVRWRYDDGFGNGYDAVLTAYGQ